MRIPWDAVVFDFDGTLVDTEWPIYLGARAAFATFGIDLPEAEWAAVVGMSDEEDGWWPGICERLGAGHIEREVWEAAKARARLDGSPSGRDAPMADGAAALVGALHGAGVPLAVASGSPVAWLEHHLDRFAMADRFDALVGVDHPGVRGGKPAPDLYLVACAALGVEPGNAVAVEDTARGIASARAAGMGAVVAVANRLTRHHDLSAADLLVPSLTEVGIEVLRTLRAA
ncbi:MAG: HAD family phosphatase [Actinobacteria bacterium]|nr:HAD family phosphatase [Actinomycetota bacterium]